MTRRPWRPTPIEQRREEQEFAETFDIPRHVLRSQLAKDDDPELVRYDYDVLGDEP